MDTSARKELGSLLGEWLGTACSPESAKHVARVTGYNDSPFFGAARKRLTLVTELAFINSALAIHFTNQIYPQPDVKDIVDSFLATSRSKVFTHLEKHDSEFHSRYEERMSEYFAILRRQEKAALAVSFAFLHHIGVNPLKSMPAQIEVTRFLFEPLKEAFGVLNRTFLLPTSAQQGAPADGSRPAGEPRR